MHEDPLPAADIVEEIQRLAADALIHALKNDYDNFGTVIRRLTDRRHGPYISLAVSLWCDAGIEAITAYAAQDTDEIPGIIESFADMHDELPGDQWAIRIFQARADDNREEFLIEISSLNLMNGRQKAECISAILAHCAAVCMSIALSARMGNH